VIVLDTNVLSELMRSFADPAVVAWLDRQPRTSIWTTSITVLEIRYGLQILATGRRRSALMSAFERLVSEKMDGRIAPFDSAAAEHAGELMAIRHKKGRPGDLRDTMIAGIVLARRGTLATRNTPHFDDLEVSVVNPWSD
jgi:predicted nucleic acid-binding protein